MTDIAPEVAEPKHRGGHEVDLLDGEFADATEHRVKAPEDAKPAKVAAKANGNLVLIKLPPRLPEGWDLDMGGAPDDGKALWTLGLDPHGAGWVAVEAVWRHTRFMNCGVWQTRGFWAIRNAGGTALPFTPVAWRVA
jgi:hypothetical protein